MMSGDGEHLVKSKQRVADHGEVFTPSWMVEDMLNLVREESERIDSRFLEPSCGSGNFLIPVLTRKLHTVKVRHGNSEFEKHHYALFALMCVYGIEILPDNVQECRNNLTNLFCAFLGVDRTDKWARSARTVLSVNIVEGDALTMKKPGGNPITFAEWSYLGKGSYQRRDFRYDELTQRSHWEAEGTLFADMGADLFTPETTYPTMTVNNLAEQAGAA
ncbi:SAM-dependent DNA methyltransferase [Bifidobacterium mongoliense]|uniref:site-specific DNA-methyltransferase (adenine-specific) n=1 Tax=Bifidobacterium mongoliense TaxID=518643 RepID=A0A423UBW9_9BIFI|nr:SAM-dependent DNA methyltransferase [Bifidobacterium mongoliense]ROT86187.1 restriction endonuclease subunit M [Bifidobacterium mongoliense]